MNSTSQAPFNEVLNDMSESHSFRTEFHDIPSFVQAAEAAVARAASTIRLRETKKTRVLRRFSVSEVAECLGCDRSFIYALLKHDGAPEGEPRGRETTYSVDDIMKFRALSAAHSSKRRNDLHWRKSDLDELPIITFCSQKGGTAKTLSCAHLAQFLQLFYGLRVGVIDGDPQATCSLYFVDQETAVGDMDALTFADFMGIPDDNTHQHVDHPAAELDKFWHRTPWPGLRLMPGGASTQAAEIEISNMILHAKSAADRRVHSHLRDNLARWNQANPPVTRPEDLIDSNGKFLEDVYQRALTETLDVIIIDSAPALTLAQFNLIYAADTMIIPQTMKGFDLAALHAYLSNLCDYFETIQSLPNAANFKTARPMILPSIVNETSDIDIRAIGEILAINTEIISPIYYAHSGGAANAFRDFKSAYEFEPDKNRKASIQRFIENANAVNDSIVRRALPQLPSRGYADAFIREKYPAGAVPTWTMGEGVNLEAAE